MKVLQETHTRQIRKSGLLLDDPEAVVTLTVSIDPATAGPDDRAFYDLLKTREIKSVELISV